MSAVSSKREPGRSSSLLTTKEAAAYLGMSVAFLERDRWAGALIPFIKVGSRAVRYEQADLDAHVEKRRRRSSSGPDAQL